MTRYLVDTHVLLWWAAEPEQLATEARIALASGHNQLLLSHVSLWELAIKISKGKLVLPGSLDELQTKARSTALPILPRHIARLIELPHHHSDPFDRMLGTDHQRYAAQGVADQGTQMFRRQHARELAAWTGRMFPVFGVNESEEDARYRQAACLLADISWRSPR